MRNRSSNEEPSPGSDHIPRLPGKKRDFGKLPVTMRSEKGKPPNLVRAEQDAAPQGTLPSREPAGRTLLKPEPTSTPQHAITRAVAKRLKEHLAKAKNK